MLSGLAQQQLTTGSLLLIQQPLLSNIQEKKRDLCKGDFFLKSVPVIVMHLPFL